MYYGCSGLIFHPTWDKELMQFQQSRTGHTHNDFQYEGNIMHRIVTKLFIIQLLVSVITVSVLAPASRAAIIDTQTVLSQQHSSTQAQLQNILAREDVREQLIAYGVDPSDADLRIAALTDYELSELQQHIDDLPAGSSALAVLGAVFLVLIVLELIGVTNVFSKI